MLYLYISILYLPSMKGLSVGFFNSEILQKREQLEDQRLMRWRPSKTLDAMLMMDFYPQAI